MPTSGPKGLAARPQPQWDARIVGRLAEMIPPGACILDVGDGYGRIVLPLAELGHQVEGLDLSPVLVGAARKTAQAQGLSVAFAVGSMTALPYETDRFDSVLCLWSSFHELLEREEQIKALAEMWRVAAEGGFAFDRGTRRAGERERVSLDVIRRLSQPPLPPRCLELLRALRGGRDRELQRLRGRLGRAEAALPALDKRLT